MLKDSKKIYIEVMRIVAIFMVLYVHSGIRAAQHYEIAGSGMSYYLSVTLRCLTQSCNMIFFMISGALLLKKEESIQYVFTHRVLKTVAIIMIFDLLQYYANYRENPAIGFSADVYFKLAYSSDVIVQYWYLHAYLAFLLMLPLLRLIVKNIKREHYWYLGGLYVFLEGILPVIERLWENGRIAVELPVFEANILCPLFGYYLVNIYDLEESRNVRMRKLAAMNVLGIAALLISVREAIILLKNHQELIVYEGFLFIMAAVLFLDVRCIFTRFSVPKIVGKIIVFIGGGVLGVYLLEPQLREGFAFIYDAIEPSTNWLIATFIWLSACVLAGSLLGRLLRIFRI